MKDHICKVMTLIDRNYLNKHSRVHHFGRHQDIEFRWEKGKNSNQAPHWSFQYKGEKRRFFFTQENVVKALREFEVNQMMFLSYLEQILLHETIYLQMSLENLEQNLGKERIDEARKACDKFLSEMKKHVDKEIKKHLKNPGDVSKTIRITDVE